MIPISITLHNSKAVLAAFSEYGLTDTPIRKLDSQKLSVDDPGSCLGSLANGASVMDNLRQDKDILHHGFMSVITALERRDACIMSNYLMLYMKQESRMSDVYIVSGTLYEWLTVLKSGVSPIVKSHIKMILGRTMLRETLNDF